MILFFILILIASIVIAFFILIQNPKGGGLSGSIAGFSTQFMGVKQTTDVLEKGTWILAIAIALLSLFSSLFISGTSSQATEPALRPGTQQTAPAPSGTPPPAPSTIPQPQP